MILDDFLSSCTSATSTSWDFSNYSKTNTISTDYLAEWGKLDYSSLFQGIPVFYQEENQISNCTSETATTKENETMNHRKNKKPGRFEIDRIHFSGPVTVIIWKDGTKSLVRAMSSTEPNPDHGFCAAVTQKVFGNNSKIKRIIREIGGVDVNREDGDAK